VLKAVNKASGIEISIIGGEEEARLIHLAAKSNGQSQEQGGAADRHRGGSVEVVLADDTNVLCTESYAMGTVRLLNILDEKAGEERSTGWLPNMSTHAAAARAGDRKPEDRCLRRDWRSIESLGELRKQLFNKNSSQKVTAEELKGLLKKLRATSMEDRIHDLRLRPDRADVIVPAAIVLHKIVQQAGVAEVVIPGIGLKDGVLLELLSQFRDREKKRPPQTGDRVGATHGQEIFFRRKTCDHGRQTRVADFRSDGVFS